MSQSISIAICTFNRQDQLAQTLEHLARLHDELGEKDEILLIDNGSTDNTEKVCRSFIESGSIKDASVRYFYESIQGLSAARNRALREFKGDWLIFFDDDITIYPQTITAYRDAFIGNQSLSFYGGKICVDWGKQAPFWYEAGQHKLIDGLVGNYDLGDLDQEYEHDSLLPFGANFAVSKALVNSVGQFDTDLGVNGKSIGRGEESDFLCRAMKVQFRGCYLSNAKVGHRFQTERINIPYLLRYGVAKGRALESTALQGWKAQAASQFLRGIYQICRGRIGNFYQCVINIGLAYGRGSISGDH